MGCGGQCPLVHPSNYTLCIRIECEETHALSVATRHRHSPSLLRKFLCLKPVNILSQTYYTDTQRENESLHVLKQEQTTQEKEEGLSEVTEREVKARAKLYINRFWVVFLKTAYHFQLWRITKMVRTQELLTIGVAASSIILRMIVCAWSRTWSFPSPRRSTNAGTTGGRGEGGGEKKRH